MSDSPYCVMRVARTVSEGAAGVSLILDGALPQAGPGQFVMLWLPGETERPYTIMDNDPLSVTVAVVGPFSQSLAALKVGDRLWVRGPYGHGFEETPGPNALLIGGGSGTASLTLLAEQLASQGLEVRAVVAARTADQLMLGWRMAELGAAVTLATDDGTSGFCGNALQACSEMFDAGWADAVYACGPEPMLIALAETTRRAGVPCWVSLERTMKCGMGVCGNCHCGDKLVCKDGPVFAAELLLD